jgi:hypothetical protein
MFIIPPSNFNQSPMCNTIPIFSEYPMMPMPDFDMANSTRQGPMSGGTSGGTGGGMGAGTGAGDNQDFEMAPGSPIPAVVNNVLYNQGWLTTQIGKYVRVSFLLGTNTFQDRTGTLVEVGISYIILREPSTNDLIMCDMYSIKFVNVFNNQDAKCPV